MIRRNALARWPSCALLATLLLGCPQDQDPTGEDTAVVPLDVPVAAVSPEAAPEDGDLQALLDVVKDLYEKAKSAGEQVPADMIQWAREDLNKMGTYRYKIVACGTEKDEELEAKLNELGAQRWQCFWIEQTGTGKRLYLRKAGRSRIQSLGRFVRLLPASTEDK